jgi:deoxyribose-phosphate aldolase
VRTVADAAIYIALTAQHLGTGAGTATGAVTAQRFRIGASGLLNDIEAVLAGAASPPPAHASSY